MEELRDRVERFIREHELIPPGGEVTCLVSGGASALLPLPAQPITLEEKQAVTRLLLDCGHRRIGGGIGIGGYDQHRDLGDLDGLERPNLGAMAHQVDRIIPAEERQHPIEQPPIAGDRPKVLATASSYSDLLRFLDRKPSYSQALSTLMSGISHSLPRSHGSWPPLAVPSSGAPR